MDATLKMSSAEFSELSLPDLKSFIEMFEHVTIEVNNLGRTLFRHETSEEYWDRIREAGEEIKQGKGMVFTMEELDEFIHKIPA